MIITPMKRTATLIARALKTASRTIAPADKREARGIVEGASYTWDGDKCKNPKGGRYLVTPGTCTCPDYERHMGVCKHLHARRIYGPGKARSFEEIRAMAKRLFAGAA